MTNTYLENIFQNYTKNIPTSQGAIAPDKEKWNRGRNYVLQGVNSNEVNQALRDIGYYLWFGDKSMFIQGNPHDDKRRADDIMAILYDHPNSKVVNYRRDEIQKEVTECCYWRRNEKPLKERQQAGNERKQFEAVKRVTGIFEDFIRKFKFVPSIKKLAAIAGCSFYVAQGVLSEYPETVISSMLEPPSAKQECIEAPVTASSRSFVYFFDLIKRKYERRKDLEMLKHPPRVHPVAAIPGSSIPKPEGNCIFFEHLNAWAFHNDPRLESTHRLMFLRFNNPDYETNQLEKQMNQELKVLSSERSPAVCKECSEKNISWIKTKKDALIIVDGHYPHETIYDVSKHRCHWDTCSKIYA